MGLPRILFIFESWFSSKSSTEAAIDVGEDLIGMVKTNTHIFYKETIEKLTRDFPGGS